MCVFWDGRDSKPGQRPCLKTVASVTIHSKVRASEIETLARKAEVSFEFLQFPYLTLFPPLLLAFSTH